MPTDSVATESGGSAALARRLGLTTPTALIVGEVIGVGIFLTPAEMARSLGSPFWLLMVWLAMAVATVGGALCYGSLAVRFPEAGGIYVYLREIFGKRTAFVYGWMALLVTDPGLTAMLVQFGAHKASPALAGWLWVRPRSSPRSPLTSRSAMQPGLPSGALKRSSPSRLEFPSPGAKRSALRVP